MGRDPRAGLSRGRASFGWLAAVDAPELLEPLFSALEACDRPGLEGLEHHETTEPIIAAIRRIGGSQALRGYERLIEEADKPFLRHRRDEVEQDLLRAARRAATPALVAELGLPSS